MSIQRIDESPIVGTLCAVPTNQIASWPSVFADIEAALDAAGGLDQGMPSSEYDVLLGDLDHVQRRLEGMRLGLISVAQKRGVARHYGSPIPGRGSRPRPPAPTEPHELM